MSVNKQLLKQVVENGETKRHIYGLLLCLRDGDLSLNEVYEDVVEIINLEKQVLPSEGSEILSPGVVTPLLAQCRCGICLAWWAQTGRGPDEDYGPFTKQEVKAERARLAALE